MASSRPIGVKTAQLSSLTRKKPMIAALPIWRKTAAIGLYLEPMKSRQVERKKNFNVRSNHQPNRRTPR
jgi:hypothetical protein